VLIRTLPTVHEPANEALSLPKSADFRFSGRKITVVRAATPGFRGDSTAEADARSPAIGATDEVEARCRRRRRVPGRRQSTRRRPLIYQPRPDGVEALPRPGTTSSNQSSPRLSADAGPDRPFQVLSPTWWWYSPAATNSGVAERLTDAESQPVDIELAGPQVRHFQVNVTDVGVGGTASSPAATARRPSSSSGRVSIPTRPSSVTGHSSRGRSRKYISTPLPSGSERYSASLTRWFDAPDSCQRS